MAPPPQRTDEIPVAILTGEYGARVLEPVLGGLGRSDVRLIPVVNRFFGGNIGVAGLLTGSDLADALTAQPVGHRYLIPDACLSEGRFLDDLTVDDLPRPVEVVPTDGASLRRMLDSSVADVSRRPASPDSGRRRPRRARDGTGDRTIESSSWRWGGLGGRAARGRGRSSQRGKVDTRQSHRRPSGGRGRGAARCDPRPQGESTPNGKVDRSPWSTPAAGRRPMTPSMHRSALRPSGPWPRPTSSCW